MDCNTGKDVKLGPNGQQNLARKFEITRRDSLLDSVLGNFRVASVSKRVSAQNHLYENVFPLRFNFVKIELISTSNVV